MTGATLSEVRPRGRGTHAIVLVAMAHFMSHFYQLVLPPLFPFLATKYDVGYTELGFIIAVFGITSGIAQTPIGFIVDRLGGRLVLVIGLASFGVAVVGYGLAESYSALLALSVVAGIANATFHPADYSILSASVHHDRLARAFGFHAVSGNLGWAAAPGISLGLHAIIGLEQTLIVLGAFGTVLAALLALRSGQMRDEALERVLESSEDNQPRSSLLDGLSLLKSRPVVMCFIFQMVHSMATGGIRTFGIAGLAALYSLTANDPDYALIGGALTAYLIAGSIGNIAGGSIIDRTGRPVLIYTVSILGIFVLIVSMGTGWLPLYAVVTLLAVAGVLQGSLLPARDVLVRAISPPGEIGKVFGFTSSGLSLGNAVMPPLFGWILDSGDPSWIFYVSGLFMLGALLTYTETSRHALR